VNSVAVCIKIDGNPFQISVLMLRGALNAVIFNGSLLEGAIFCQLGSSAFDSLHVMT
jgi:hypothetical protein